jgi:3-hydroxyacyl-CoA dehydrogenase
MPAPRLQRVCILAPGRDGIAAGRAFRKAGLDVAFWEDAPGAMAGADLVFDPTFTSIEAHRALIGRAAPHIAPGTIVATMAADAVADLVPAENALGLHFLYPADERRFVEVIRPAAAATATVLAVMRLLKRMDKTAVIAAPAPGAIAARLMTARQQAAETLVCRGVASPWQADRVLREFGFAEGVFAWQDRIGLDTAWLRTGDAEGDALRARLCAAGRPGRAAGAGFFDYPAGLPQRSAAAEALSRGGAAPEWARHSLRDALLLPVANAGLELLRAGVALRASDIDLAAITAHGWPAWRGGPLFHLEQVVGAPLALAFLEHLEGRFGAFYRPSPLLRDLADGRIALAQYRAEVTS